MTGMSVNLQKWLSGIFALTMMAQAMISVVYVHHSDATGAEYVSFDHNGELPAALAEAGSEKSNESPAKDFDSHNCSHYIGVFLTLTAGVLKIAILSEKTFGYGLKFPSASISPDLRPPIL